MPNTTDLRPGDRIPMSWVDYQQLDDQIWGEYIDGEFVVSPSPIPRHQRICGNLERIIHETLPAKARVLMHAGWRVGGDEFVSDVVAYDQETETETHLEGTPHLMVEVLSTDRAVDTIRKHHKYAQAGVPRYWIIDPDGPEVVVYHLVEDTYHEIARHGPGQVATFDLGPVEIAFDPAQLDFRRP